MCLRAVIVLHSACGRSVRSGRLAKRLQIWIQSPNCDFKTPVERHFNDSRLLGNRRELVAITSQPKYVDVRPVASQQSKD